MDPSRKSPHPQFHAHCCPCGGETAVPDGLSRRTFLGGVGVALTGLTWAAVRAAERELQQVPPRRTLTVKPVLLYSTPTRRNQTSWRSWGGIQTQQDADAEMARIRDELGKLQSAADFPLAFLPLSGARSPKDLEGVADLASADVVLVYAAGHGGDALNTLAKLGKDVIIFVRHKSGPVYLWYEIISPRFLRQHTDAAATPGIDSTDVVVDSQEEILWRLRSLCGLRGTVGSRILAVGGASAWAQPKGVVPDLVRQKWKLDIQVVSYADLGKLIQEARADAEAAALARRRAADYLASPGTTLETKKEFVENAFLLDQVFRGLMKKADCRAITINSCMGTIMPLAQTTACLALSTLNDDGYLAFCESDFVVVPSGILLGAISGLPTFLNDPTYPHDGIITLAHCTAPRKMDGKGAEPVRVLTHFESDYGAAPKVEMRRGQKVTMIIPDFASERWVGLGGEIIDAPFLPICRSQIDVRFNGSSDVLAARMPGFHWMAGYGDYLRELGYALRRIPIQWECLG